MEPGKIVEVLATLQSADNSARQAAEKLYTDTRKTAPDSLAVGLLAVVGNAGVDPNVRAQGAVLLRQLFQKDQGPDCDFTYGRLTPANQAAIAEQLLRTYEAETLPKLQQKVGEAISLLAETLCDRSTPGAPGWPALLPLVFRMADASQNPRVDSCESALELLKDLVLPLKTDVIGAKAQLGQILQAGLTGSEIKVKAAAMLLICAVVAAADHADWAPLASTANLLTQVVQQIAAAGMQDKLQEVLQAYDAAATATPDFFTAQLSGSMEPANLLTSIARARGSLEDGTRQLALEWLVSYAESKSTWLQQSLPAYVPQVLEVCLQLMLELEDGEAELRAWAERMDDEEGEDDSVLINAGANGIDRIFKAVGVAAAGPKLFELVGRFQGQPQWQAKHASLSAIGMVAEYVDEMSHVNELANVLMQHVEHPHARVRFEAYMGLGRMSTDQSPHFQDEWHKRVMPIFLAVVDDPVERVAEGALMAFQKFADDLDKTLIAPYAEGLTGKLMAKLQTTRHRGLREECISSIAVIAGQLEEDFSRFYDVVMPVLKQFVVQATGEKEKVLRGKAFECMSFLGAAVGKEKFFPDAQAALGEMTKTPLAEDDPQRDYIKESSERICQCLKKDFAAFLPTLLPGIFRSLVLEARGGSGLQDDKDSAVLRMSDGKIMKVRTEKFQELQQSIELLGGFCTNIEGAYFDWVQPTAEAVLPMLGARDKFSLSLQVRNSAFELWAKLIKVAVTGAAERGVTGDVARTLLQTFLRQVTALMESETDPDVLQGAALGISKCLEGHGPGALSAAELPLFVRQIFAFMDQSLARSAKLEADHRNKAAPTADPNEPVDEVKGGGGDEDMCRRSYTVALSAMMQVAPAEFASCLPEVAERISGLLGSDKNKAMALHLCCNLIEFLKEGSQPAWPAFMPEVFRVLDGSDSSAKTPAAYAVCLAAPLASFDEAAPDAYRKLARVVSAPAPTKTDHSGRAAVDNAVSALVSLGREKPTLCPPEVDVWGLVVSKLPLREDDDEAQKVHEAIADMMLQQHAGLLKGGEEDRLGKILSALAEVRGNDELCTESADAKIAQIFKLISPSMLQAVAGRLTEKQQRKIENLLSAAAAA